MRRFSGWPCSDATDGVEARVDKLHANVTPVHRGDAKLLTGRSRTRACDKQFRIKLLAGSNHAATCQCSERRFRTASVAIMSLRLKKRRSRSASTHDYQSLAGDGVSGTMPETTAPMRKTDPEWPATGVRPIARARPPQESSHIPALRQRQHWSLGRSTHSGRSEGAGPI